LNAPLSAISRFAAFALAIFLCAAAGHAGAPPDNIAEALGDAAQACRNMNGIPNTDAILKAEDLNGDGGEDWIADYSKFKCEGGVNPLCGEEGCTLQLYFWDGDMAWDVLFEDVVKSYKFGKSGGKPMLYVTTSGLPCNKPVTDTCQYTYRLEKDSVVPVK
jgi:hypothetical protein